MSTLKSSPKIDYKNISLLKKYVSDNRKIISSKISSVSPNKQRVLTREMGKNFRINIAMELILLENILKLGSIGDKVKVKNGYGRNFLLKKGKALRFNKENLEFVNKKKNELNKKNIEVKTQCEKIAKLINNKELLFSKESKENGEMYGSIKPKEITNLINEKYKAIVKPSQIILKSELNKIGSYKIDILLHSEVSATLTVKIDKIKSS